MRAQVETQCQIEFLRIFRYRVDYDPANANGIGGMDHALRRIPKQGPAQATPVKLQVHSEAPKYGHRNRIGHVSPEPAGCVLHDDRSRSQCIVADYALSVASNISSRCSARLVSASAPLQPVVEGQFSGGEFVKTMMTGQGLRW